jgi:hypothetical protein
MSRIFAREIAYDPETRDFACSLDGELVCFARTHQEGEAALDELVHELLTGAMSVPVETPPPAPVSEAAAGDARLAAAQREAWLLPRHCSENRFLTLRTADLIDSLCDAVDAARIAAAGNQRWLNAIDAAWEHLLQADEIDFQPESGALLYRSESGQVYTANGTCQCIAYTRGEPCKHRAASRLVKRALALTTA